MKLLISGKIGSGKSYLVNQLIQDRDVCGFYVREVLSKGKRTGFQMCSYHSNEKQVFSYTNEDGKQSVISGVFDEFGVKLLKEAMHLSERILVIDEIGRLERNEQLFLNTLTECFDTCDSIIAVLKKEKLPHIDALKTRQDVVYLDLDRIGRSEALRISKKEMEGI